jgi:hypothetical protein
MGGLGLVDEREAIKVFLSKLVIHTLEPMNSKLQLFFRYHLQKYQLRKGGK